MSARHFSLIAATLALLALPGAAQADSQPQAALAGTVSSAEEGPMEGVVVSAKKDGSTITVSVVTDAKGRLASRPRGSSPASTRSARAAGYELDGRQERRRRRRTDSEGRHQARDDARILPQQLTNAEWLVSMPGTDQQKKALLNCDGCHTLERIMKSTYDADGFLEIFERMSGYYPGSTPVQPQRLAGDARRRTVNAAATCRTIAEWLASVNLSQQRPGPSRSRPCRGSPASRRA